MDSLILQEAAREEAQPLLFSSAELPGEMFEAEEQHGNYTGERFFSRRPEAYKQAVSMIAEGVSDRSICRALRITHHTLEAVREREGVSITAEKKGILQRAARVARVTIDRLAELAPEMSAKDAAVTFGIVTDKMLVMSGDVNSRVEVRQSDPIGDYLALLQQLPREKSADAREIGSAAEEKCANGAGLELTLPVPGEAGIELAGDAESPVLPAATGLGGSGATGFDTAGAADSGSDRAESVRRSDAGGVGGEGVRAADGGAEIQIHDLPQKFSDKGGNR